MPGQYTAESWPVTGALWRSVAAPVRAELRNLAAEPEHAALALEYAQKMLSWRMQVRAIAAAFAPLHALTGRAFGRTRTARSRT